MAIEYTSGILPEAWHITQWFFLVAVKMSVLFLMVNTNLTHFSPPFGQEIVCRRRKIPA